MRVSIVAVVVLLAVLVVGAADGWSTPPASATIVAQGRRGGRYGGPIRVFKLKCKLCGGTGRMVQRVGPAEDCIGCAKGTVIVRLRSGDGICPECGGTTWVKEAEASALSMSGCSPCKKCLGGGTLPLSEGGTREGLEPARSSGPAPVRTEPAKDPEPTPEPEEGFFLKYRMWIVAAGGGLLILAFVASKASGKGK